MSPPLPPTGLRMAPTPGDGGRRATELDVVWERAVGAMTYDLAAAGQVRRSGLVETLATIDQVAPLSVVELKVRARNADGVSDWSPPLVSATRPPAPPTPQLIAPRPDDDDEEADGRDATSLQLAFSAGLPAAPAATFRVQITARSDAEATRVATLPASGQVTALAPNRGYSFRLSVVVTGFGESAWSEPSEVYYTRPAPIEGFAARNLVGLAPGMQLTHGAVAAARPALQVWVDFERTDRDGKRHLFSQRAEPGRPGLYSDAFGVPRQCSYRARVRIEKNVAPAPDNNSSRWSLPQTTVVVTELPPQLRTPLSLPIPAPIVGVRHGRR